MLEELVVFVVKERSEATPPPPPPRPPPLRVPVDRLDELLFLLTPSFLGDERSMYVRITTKR